jgi:ribosome assembly protein YihI (activator of Der GTPase)
MIFFLQFSSKKRQNKENKMQAGYGGASRNSSTEEAEARGWQVQDQPKLHSKAVVLYV